MKPFRPFLFPKGDNYFENGAPMGAAFQPIGSEKKGAEEGKGRRSDEAYSTASATIFHGRNAGRQGNAPPFQA